MIDKFFVYGFKKTLMKHARQLILQKECSRLWFDWFAPLFTRLKQA